MSALTKLDRPPTITIAGQPATSQSLRKPALDVNVESVLYTGGKAIVLVKVSIKESDRANLRLATFPFRLQPVPSHPSRYISALPSTPQTAVLHGPEGPYYCAPNGEFLIDEPKTVGCKSAAGAWKNLSLRKTTNDNGVWAAWELKNSYDTKVPTSYHLLFIIQPLTPPKRPDQPFPFDLVFCNGDVQLKYRSCLANLRRRIVGEPSGRWDVTFGVRGEWRRGELEGRLGEKGGVGGVEGRIGLGEAVRGEL